MLKKVISLALATVVASSLVVMPTHAASFSEDNWVQFERGFYTSGGNFSFYGEQKNDAGVITAVKAVANGNATLEKNRNPVGYKCGDSASHYGEYADKDADFAHLTFKLAMYSDEYRNAMKYLTMRMDKDGTGNSSDAFVFDANSEGQGWVYPVNYKNSNSLNFRDADGVWALSAGPASSITPNSHQTTLADSEYHKIDIISDLTSTPINYVFVDGRYMCAYRDSNLDTEHFHGVVFRVLSGRKIRGNSDYIAVKMYEDRIGHREYYSTDYIVTFEDVMNDAGLGDAIEEGMIFKTSNLQDFMPGAAQKFNVWPKDASGRSVINNNVSYSGDVATISYEAENSDSFVEIANMLAGVYPQFGMGVSYTDYHPRAKYIKLSFDQTISNDSAWIEYDSKYSGTVEAMKMWNNGGKLVVGIKGGDNVTCNGNGHKPTATMTGTNHIDWILEPVEKEGCVKQYVYINGKLAGEGQFGNEHAVRINDIVIKAKGSVDLTIENWSMTLYNDEVVLNDNGEIVIPEPEVVEPLVIEEVDMGEYEGKAWDVVINEFDSEATYSAVFTDGEDSIDGEIGFDNVETEGSIAFAVFLHTSRANVAFDIVAE